MRSLNRIPVDSPSPRQSNGRLRFVASFGIPFISRLLRPNANIAQRFRPSKSKNVQKKIERLFNHVVYYSMTLRGRQGSTRPVRGLGCNTDSSTNSEMIFGCELRSGPHSAGQRSNTGATVWWTPWSGGIQGLSARVELKSTPHWSRNHRNPCAEKGSTTRSQQISFGGGALLVAQCNEGYKGWGTNVVAPPRLQSFL